MVSTSSFSKSIDVWNIGQIDLVHCRNPTHWRCPKNWQTYAVCNGLKCTFKQMQLLEEYLVSYTPNSTTLALTCCEPCKPIPNRCTRPNTYRRSLACGMRLSMWWLLWVTAWHHFTEIMERHHPGMIYWCHWVIIQMEELRYQVLGTGSGMILVQWWVFLAELWGMELCALEIGCVWHITTKLRLWTTWEWQRPLGWISLGTLVNT